MKNLFTKTILLGGLAGSLAFGGCENKSTELENKQISKKVEKQLTELEKYNLENKQVYEDFLKFCIENPNKKEYAKSQYELRLSNNKNINFVENGYVKLYNNEKSFTDSDGKGLDNKLVDGQTFENKNTNLIETEFIKNMPSEKQLSVAKEYANALKEILHEEKYKNY